MWSVTLLSDDAGHQCLRYDIEDLAEQGNFLDSAHLLLMGELPTSQQKAEFDRELTMHTLVHEQLIQFFKGFKHDAHPMAIMVGVVGALAAFEPYSADLACAPASGPIMLAPAQLATLIWTLWVSELWVLARGAGRVLRKGIKGNGSDEGFESSGIPHHGCGDA